MGKRKSEDVPGNVLASLAALDQVCQRLGQSLLNWDRAVSPAYRGEVEVTGFSIRVPGGSEEEVLVVIRGLWSDGSPVVGFHSEVGVAQAVANAGRRVADGNIKWRADEYRTGANRGRSGDGA